MGVICCCFLGNHDYYTGDVDGWIKELDYLGVTPLRNSHVLLTHPNQPQAKLCLAGVDDTEGGFLRQVVTIEWWASCTKASFHMQFLLHLTMQFLSHASCIFKSHV